MGLERSDKSFRKISEMESWGAKRKTGKSTVLSLDFDSNCRLMLDKIFRNIQEKSLKERFLLFIGVLFFVLYFILGLLFIFMDNFPLDMKIGYRDCFWNTLGFICLYKVFRIMIIKVD
jgi:hypothetical protein